MGMPPMTKALVVSNRTIDGSMDNVMELIIISLIQYGPAGLFKIQFTKALEEEWCRIDSGLHTLKVPVSQMVGSKG
jgi:hypothetical protein